MPEPRCPICQRPLLNDVVKQPRPFCSRRCKMADLGNWLDGRYAIAEQGPMADLEGLSPDDLDLSGLLSDHEDEEDR